MYFAVYNVHYTNPNTDFGPSHDTGHKENSQRKHWWPHTVSVTDTTYNVI